MRLILIGFLITVIDLKSGEPMIGAEVLNLSNNTSLYTDLSGKVITNDSCIDYKITAIGYESDTITIVSDTTIKLNEE